ncbi:MAG: GNAT family N-acetyltransferase [Planctomycetaceae bacterium]
MLTVSAVSEAERFEALSILFEHLPAGERSQQVDLAQSLADDGQLQWEGLLVARENGIVHGVCLTVAQPDGSLGVWIPIVSQAARRLHSQQQQIVAQALLDEVGRRQDRSRMAFAQCLLEATPHEAEGWLAHAGFRRMAELSFLERDLSRPLPVIQNGTFEIETFREGVNDERFADLVERSYQQSLDCPDFTGLRTGKEALLSHRATGVFHPELWQIFRGDENDLGVLLCADHPDLDAWELAYMGVVPEGRGQRLGQAMVTQALHGAKNAGRKRMQLAVDSVNTYANAVYKQSGFEEQCRRTVYLRRLAGSHQQVMDG